MVLSIESLLIIIAIVIILMIAAGTAVFLLYHHIKQVEVNIVNKIESAFVKSTQSVQKNINEVASAVQAEEAVK
jgi:hypothetical protein